MIGPRFLQVAPSKSSVQAMRPSVMVTSSANCAGDRTLRAEGSTASAPGDYTNGCARSIEPSSRGSPDALQLRRQIVHAT
jgi:hypothetical protein